MLQNIQKSSMSESAYSSMKTYGHKKLWLIDFVYADLTDAAEPKAKWIN